MSKIACLAFLVFVTFVAADLPMHCIRDQVIGIWKLEIGDETTAMAGARDLNCGLATPHSAEEAMKPFPVKTKERFKLSLPYHVQDMKTKKNGTWTIIYDEGLEIQINDKKYFSYFKYENLDNGLTRSTCSQLLNGYVHKDDRSNWGCWKATREGPPQFHDAKPAPSEEMTKREAEMDALAENGKVDMSPNHPEWHNLKYAPETDMVDAINAMQTEWSAKVYPQFEGKSLHELAQMAGGHSNKAGEENNIANFLQMDLSEQSDDQLREMLKGKEAEKDKNGDKSKYVLPEKFDWRNVHGKNYLFPAVDQGSCGSCYAVAVADMITSRVAVQTNNSVRVPMAAQEIIECGEKWNQGCDGGFPYLASKYVSDFGLTSEACYKYAERGFNAPRHYGNGCQLDQLAVTNSKACQYRVKASKYEYVGGCYGCATEDAMMREIYENGPIVVGFQVNMAMMHYSAGIFLQVDLPDVQLNPWEQTNHAVLVVGWGVSSKGTKYWAVKNSWGAQWGNKGYFYVERGSDTMAFESMPVMAVPTVTQAHHIESKFSAHKQIV